MFIECYRGGSRMKNLILFVDVGIDDAFALIYLLKNPTVNLVAVVAGYGNTDRDRSYRNAKYILQLAGREDVPVIIGSTRPLDGSEPTFYPEIHGPEGLGPIKPPVQSKRYQYASDFSLLFALIKEYANEITIVATGRFTSLTMAWELSPSTMELVTNTVILGGAFSVPGNVTSLAEANFNGDAIAANYITTHVPNLTIIPLNVTMDSYITPKEINQLNEEQTDQVGRLLKPIYDYYRKYYQQTNPQLPGAPIHDLVAAMVGAGVPVVAEYVSKSVSVSYQDQETTGLSIADFRASPDECQGNIECSEIGLSLNRAKYIEEVFRILTLNVEHNHEVAKVAENVWIPLPKLFFKD